LFCLIWAPNGGSAGASKLLNGIKIDEYCSSNSIIMKKVFFALVFTFTSSILFAQIKVQVKGDQVFVNKVHQFDIYTTGSLMMGEAIVKDKSGNILLSFISNRRPDGYSSSTSYDSKGRMNSSSGTTYLYYYRITDTNGNFCEIKSYGLQNKRNIATYLINNNLIVDGVFNLENYIRFCQTHGAPYSVGY